jgi:hypothetical protein
VTAVRRLQPLPSLVAAAIWTGAVVAILLVLRVANIFRYIPNNQVRIAEKMWAAKGSIKSGFIALHGEWRANNANEMAGSRCCASAAETSPRRPGTPIFAARHVPTGSSNLHAHPGRQAAFGTGLGARDQA